MRKLFWLLILLVLVFMARPIWEDKASEYVDLGFLAPIDRAVDQVTEGPAIENALTQAKQFTLQVGGQLKSFVASSSAEMPVAVSKPALDETQSLFAVHNVTLGMTKEEAQAKVGLPLRLMRNEYGTDWHSYHQDYQNYVLLSYDQEGKVNGMFTNQALISSTKGITMQSKRAEVRSALGIPLKSLQKGNVQYILDTREEYDVFKIDSIYITVFYDLQEENTVTAIQVIDGGLEENRPEIYAEPNDEVREGYEYLLFELTNSARIQRSFRF